MIIAKLLADIVNAYGHDIADRWLLKDGITEANKVTWYSLMSGFKASALNAPLIAYIEPLLEG